MRTRRGLALSLIVVVGLGLGGCSVDGLLKSNELPPNVTDPAITQTPEGALQAYHGTIALFRNTFGVDRSSAVAMAGMLSDELVTLNGDVVYRPVDQRLLPEGIADVYSPFLYAGLQKIRGQAAQTIGLLTHYRPADPALAGHAYAIAAYAEVLLAELFCSGVPLSTLDYDGDYTYRPGSSTADVFAHATALFDTALALAGDSASILNLARVGQARALLARGDYAGAATVVAAVPDDYRSTLTFIATGDRTTWAPNVLGNSDATPWGVSVADREGIKGLDWRSSGDPRTPTTNITNVLGSFWYPTQYAQDGSSPIVVASGVEARLIAAEAALHAGDPSWLTTLNTLRTDGTQDGSGTYNPGTGGVAGLAPLADPGAGLATPASADSARVDLLFRERGFWLFLTGHRQGDLRRLIRQYGRTQEQVYPIGPHGATGNYGTDVTIPIPPSERLLNPHFTGCASRGA